MKTFFILILISFTKTYSADLEINIEPAPANFQISGKTYNIDTKKAFRALSKNTVNEIVKAFNTELGKLGYQQIDSYNKSHITIYLTSGTRKNNIDANLIQSFFSPIDKTKTSKTTVVKEEAFVNGKKVFSKQIKSNNLSAYMGFYTYVKEFEKRPKLMSSGWINSPSKSWTGYEQLLPPAISNNLKELFPAAPKENLPMKGNPGCMPLFGYELDQETGKLIAVPKNSSAADAGLKTGDILIAIDSTPFTQPVDDAVYESRTPVPIKYKRGERIMRGMIHAKISCEEF
jgi:hypothetical protein